MFAKRLNLSLESDFVSDNVTETLPEPISPFSVGNMNYDLFIGEYIILELFCGDIW